MDDVGFARFAPEIPVSLVGNFEGLFNKLMVARFPASDYIVYQGIVFRINKLNVFLVKYVLTAHKNHYVFYAGYKDNFIELNCY